MAFGGAVKLTGESEYRNALRQITQELKTLSSEMKVVATAYDKNDKSVSTLKAKQDDLNKVLEKQKATLANATKAYNDFNAKVQAQKAEHQALEKEYKDAVTELERIKQTSGEASEEYQEQAQVVAELAQKYKKSTEAQTQNEVSLGKLETQLNNAQSAVNGTERELDQLEKELDQAENSTDDFNDSLAKTGDSAKKAESGFTVLKGVLANLISDGITTCINKLQDLAKQTIATGASFDSSMSNVGAISGATGKELEALREKAKEMGKNTKFSASEAADGLSYMAMAGWKTDDMLQGLDGIMHLAAASGSDLATTSDIVTDALTAFGKSASDSTRLADIMAATSANANTNVDLLGETFKYCASTAGALGFSMEDTSVAIGLMANSGVKGSQAGTSLKNILVNLSKPTKQMQTAMDDLGISLTDSEGNMKSLDTIMGEMKTAFSGLTEKQKASYAATIAGKEGMSGLLAIVNSSPKDFDKLTNAVNNSNGAAKKMADTMNDNLAGDMTMLNSHLESVQISLYEKFEPALRAGVEVLNDLLDAVQFVVDHSTEFLAAITAMGAGIAAYLAYTTAMTVMTQGWQALTIVTKAQAAAQAMLNAVMALNPIGLVIAAIVALVAAFVILWRKSEAFRNFWTKLWQKIKSVASSAITWLAGAWKKLKENAIAVWNTISSTASKVWNKIKEFIINPIKQALSNVKTTFSNIYNTIKSRIDSAKTAVNNAANKIKSVLSFSGLKSKVASAFNAVKSAVMSPMNKAKDAVKGIVDKIKGFFHFKVPTPHIPVPHFSISPKGWKVNDLLKGQIPKLGVTWRAKGGVFDKKTILAGVGENGAEAIVPLERNTKWIKRVASEFKPFLADSIEIPPIYIDNPQTSQTMMSDLDIIRDFKEALSQMKVILDDEKMGKFIDKTVSDKIYSF